MTTLYDRGSSHPSTGAGISIRAAGTGADAEDLLAKEEYDAIISEHVLPGKRTGLHCCGQ